MADVTKRERLKDSLAMRQMEAQTIAKSKAASTARRCSLLASERRRSVERDKATAEEKPEDEAETVTEARKRAVARHVRKATERHSQWY
mmetsp:Transcript_29569/g.74389  ORF Transcript_29569/g.74389 Transcript_29569/m.74389 type:complete len:89 (-) Transcript_29569:366-632(-)